MTTKRIAIKVYLDEDSEIYKRVSSLAEKTTLSLSSLAGMAMRHGLSSVEQTMKHLFEGTEVFVEKPSPRKKSRVKSK